MPLFYKISLISKPSLLVVINKKSIINLKKKLGLTFFYNHNLRLIMFNYSKNMNLSNLQLIVHL